MRKLKIVQLFMSWGLWLLLRTRAAIAKGNARSLYKMTGRRYFVLRYGHKYKAFCNKDIKALKKQGIIKKDLDIAKLFDICIYKTK